MKIGKIFLEFKQILEYKQSWGLVNINYSNILDGYMSRYYYDI